MEGNIEIKEEEILEPYGFIYVTTNMVNGKKYIGQKMFKKDWKYYLGSGAYFLRAVKKYGKKNFSREIIAIAYSKEELDILEVQFINHHNAVNSTDYYNLVGGGYGGNAGIPASEEQKKKMSDSHKGHETSEETRKKIGEARKGHLVSEATRDKISNTLKNYIITDEHRTSLSESGKGRIFSEETKLKISESHKGKNMALNSEQIVEIREKYATGEYKQYELAEIYFVTKQTINNVVNYKYAYKNVS